MSDLQAIQSALETTSRRRRWQNGIDRLWLGLLIGSLLWLVTLVLYKFLPLPVETPLVGGALALCSVIVAFCVGFFRKATVAESARWLDQRQHLQERLSTALEVSAKPTDAEWQRLLLADAARQIQKLDPRKLLPFSLPRAARWSVLVLAIGAGLGFVPEYRSAKLVQKQKEQENIKAVGQQLAELARRSLTNRPPALEATSKSLENVAELGDHLARAPLTRTDALRDLANVADKLKMDLKSATRGPALKRMEKAARERSQGGSSATPGELQKRMEDMQKALGEKSGDKDALDKLQKKIEQAKEMAAGLPAKDAPNGNESREQLADMLSSLAREAKDLGQSLSGLEEAIAALNDLEKMRDMAKALQQLQQQAAKLGKDLAEQLKNGQAEAAQQTLQKMMEQLKNGQLKPEDLQKLMREVSEAVDPAKEYGECSKALAKAAQQMKAGQKGEAGQSLAEAEKELAKLLQQLGDAESLMATLESLQRAQMAVGTCQSMGACRKPGVGPGGKPGSGVGTWADEDGWLTNIEMTERWDNTGIDRPDMDPRGQTDRGDPTLPDNLAPTKLRGQISPGGSMPSITLKGVSIKGASTVQLQEAAPAAQADAQSALNQDQVPRAYQSAVKEYFNDLKK
jgi:hypothetical protein